MNILNNLDLLSVGTAIAGIGILGFTVYFNDKESITNRSFLWFSIITIFWGIINYLSYQFSNETLTLWFLRGIMFFAVLQAFFLYRLFYVFPNKKIIFKKHHIYIIVPIVIATVLITLTPYVFTDIIGETVVGKVANVVKGPGIFLFAITATGLIVRGIYLFLRKTFTAKTEEKKQFKIVLLGAIIMFVLIIIFNFIIPVFYNNPKFIPFGALFIFPFIAFTSYAILKHKLFDIKIIATAVLAFVLSIVTFLEIIFSEGFEQVMFRSSVFILVLIFSIFLLKSVRKEVAQREQIQRLADNLEKANTRLKELDKLKSEFVSFATHQIRAPITAIKGYISLILEGSYGEVSDKIKEAVERVRKSSESLSMVVEDYLNISRIETGEMKYNFKVMDFGKLVREVAQELTPVIKQDGLKLKIDVDENKEYKAKIDEGKMKQIITNLIDNAVKYTDVGHIEISVSKDEKRERVKVKVADTGIGISKETMSKLFQKFSRAKDANKTNIRGTGIGLYIAKVMTEAHNNGRIWAESEGEGKGSRFYVEIGAV